MTYVWNKNKVHFNHHKNIPESFRMLIVGSSGSGKTQLLFKMLLEPNFLDYDNLIIFSKTIFQDEYQILYHAFMNNLSKENISKIFKDQDLFNPKLSIKEICETISLDVVKPGNINISMYDKIDEIINPNDLDKSKKNLIIFDDCVTMKNQEVMSSYYTRGRHNNCNCIYLSQSWFDLPKKTIRNNSNFIILFKLNKRDKDLIYYDVLSNTVEKDDFNLLNHHWKQNYNYVAFNKNKDVLLKDVFE